MSSLSKTISLVAAAAAVTGPSTAAAQRRGGGRGNFLQLPHHTDDRALKSDGNATAAAATVPEVARIVDGTPTGRPIPSMMGLGKQNQSSPYFVDCGGTLIGPKVVLTTANCMYDYNIDDEFNLVDSNWGPVDQVFVNLYDVNDPAGVVTINIQDPSEGGRDIVVHPEYTVTDGIIPLNDIALVFLPVGQLAEYAKPNDDPHEPVVSDPMTVMGWGRLTEDGDYSEVLRETTVNYISNEECKEKYAYQIKNEGMVITDGMMCGFKKFPVGCDGDTGGPLFLEEK